MKTFKELYESLTKHYVLIKKTLDNGKVFYDTFDTHFSAKDISRLKSKWENDLTSRYTNDKVVKSEVLVYDNFKKWYKDAVSFASKKQMDHRTPADIPKTEAYFNPY